MQSPPVRFSNPKRSKQAVQTLGLANAPSQTIKRLLKHEITGFWIHLDVNVLT